MDVTGLDIFLRIAIPLLSACLGAILAFRYQHTMELKRDKRAIVQSLMINRNVGALELDYIKALNSIDLVYYKHKRVRELYHTFIAQTTPPLYKNGQWQERLYELIYEMAQHSGYKGISMHDIRDFYSPEILLQHYRGLFDPEKLAAFSAPSQPQTIPDKD